MMPIMIGTALNSGGIVLGGLYGLLRRKPLSPATESYLKVALAAFTVFYGLKLTLTSLHGSAWQISKQLLIAVLALGLGRWTGTLLRLQETSNRLGQMARARMEAAGGPGQGRFSDGFQTCAVLFCIAPLGLIGAIEDGLADYFYPLAVKAVMDGLATMGLVRLLGWSVIFSALPVLALQGSITLVCAQWLKPVVLRFGLADSINATGGLMIFSVALVILQLKRIPLADYLPSIVYAGVLAWIWR